MPQAPFGIGASALGFVLLTAGLSGAAVEPLHAQDPGMQGCGASYSSPSPGQAAWETELGLELREVTLGRAISVLESRTGVAIAYSPSLLPLDRLVTCLCPELTAFEVLSTVLGGTGFEPAAIHGQLVLRLTPEAAIARSAPADSLLSVGVSVDALTAATAPPLRPATGTIRGSVGASGSGEPISAAQVHIPDLDLGTLTTPEGEFELENVPAGTHTVVAQRLGRGSADRQVEVRGDGSSEVDFELEQRALALDEVVVTGTPRGTRRRAIGNAVGRVEAARVAEVAPAATMQNLLIAREPGLTFHGADGSVGTGRVIRIRGISSLSLGQQPLIYVDGIRVDNEAETGPAALRGSAASRLNDFNPDEIEDIEIIKGPAAATLYGTEASAGVIQLITKKGSVGAPRFDLTIRQGGNWLRNAADKVGDAYGLDPTTGELLRFNIIDHEKEVYGRSVFTTGHLQSYNLSMRGGSALVRYFLSAERGDNTGMVDYNWDRRNSLRANVNLVPGPRWTLDVSTGYVDGLTSFMQQSRYDVWYTVRMATPLTVRTRDRGFFRAPPEVSRTLEATREYKRFTGSATITHTPTPWLTQRLIVGTDQTNEENTFLAPRQEQARGHWLGGLALGRKEVELPSTVTNTLDYAASATYRSGSLFDFTTSFGLQYYARTARAVYSEGSVFPAPSMRSLSGLSEVFTTESFEENVSLGMYLQQDLSWRDRVYLTAALRGDDNSAFGANYDAALYPKLSATWMVTDEDFWEWDGWVSSLRLRSAWGQAGRQPSSFAAVTRYAPTVALEGQPAVEPSVLGNPDLGPELSTELEVGLDISMWRDRLTGQFTYYTQRVEDVLVSVPVVSSGGFPGVQDQNLGRLSNRGWEIQLDGRLVERPLLTLDVGLSLSRTENRIDDLGGVPETDTLQEGFHFPGAFYVTPVPGTGTIDENGQPVGILCDYGIDVVDGYGRRGGEIKPCNGQDSPPPRLYWGPLGSSPNEAAMHATLTIGGSLSLYALGEWRGFHRIEGNDPLCRFFCYPNDRYAVEREVPVILCATDGSNLCGGGDASRTIHGANASFAKLRELSATYRFPRSFTSWLGATGGSVTVAGRDLFTWQAQRCTPDGIPGYPECYGGTTVADPETRDSSQSLEGGNPNSGGVSALPGLSSVALTVRLTF